MLTTVHVASVYTAARVWTALQLTRVNVYKVLLAWPVKSVCEFDDHTQMFLISSIALSKLVMKAVNL